MRYYDEVKTQFCDFLFVEIGLLLPKQIVPWEIVTLIMIIICFHILMFDSYSAADTRWLLKYTTWYYSNLFPWNISPMGFPIPIKNSPQSQSTSKSWSHFLPRAQHWGRTPWESLADSANELSTMGSTFVIRLPAPLHFPMGSPVLFMIPKWNHKKTGTYIF